MSTSIVPHPTQSRNPQIAFVPAETLPEPTLPGPIQVADQTVHTPVIEGDTPIVDTGRAILDLTPAEVAVLRVVIRALDIIEVV